MAGGIVVHAIGDKIGKVTGDVVGYYDHIRRRVGDRFEIQKEQHFSKRWMSRATEKEAKETNEQAADLHADQRRRHVGKAAKPQRPSDDLKI